LVPGIDIFGSQLPVTPAPGELLTSVGTNTHTHTHTHIYIYIYIYICTFTSTLFKINMLLDALFASWFSDSQLLALSLHGTEQRG
jgi:hypothetical protein